VKDYTPGRLERARSLRRTDADAEMRLWHALRSRQLTGWKFRRQHPVGPFVVDFVCLAAGLVVEVDGAHHAEQRVKDEARTRFIESKGFRVVRFDDGQVLKELGAVLEVIRLALEAAPHPNPLPAACGAREQAGMDAPLARETTDQEPSPRSRGEGRVRGKSMASPLNPAPHPNPLPARGARERAGMDAPSARETTDQEASPRLRGESRVRGKGMASPLNPAPHPNPLPARGARERAGMDAPLARETTDQEPSPRSRGEGRVRGKGMAPPLNPTPHPNPLPASGARERAGMDASPETAMPNEEPSPRSRGEGRVRGKGDATPSNPAPHPNPLPARGARERVGMDASPETAMPNEEPSPRSRGEGRVRGNNEVNGNPQGSKP
jgi:very-short-patch-repair endonuclease